jgi:hypothetical protein
MRFRRKTCRLGPLCATITPAGRWSFGITNGLISHHFTRRRTSIDTPGPIVP